MKRWLATAAAVTAATQAYGQPPAGRVVPGVVMIRIQGSAAGGPAAPMPNPGNPNPNPNPQQDPGADLRSVVASVAFKNIYEDVVYRGKPASVNNPKRTWINHEFGKTLPFVDNVRFHVVPLIPGPQNPQMPQLNPEAVVNARYEGWKKAGGFDGLLDLVSFALSHDQVDAAIGYAKELAKNVETKKDAKPSDRVTAFLAAAKELLPKLESDLPAAPEAEEWRKRLAAPAKAEERHYTVVHFGDQSVSAESLAGKLAELERNFRGFYLWHAATGQKAAFPAKKLVAVIAKKADEIEKLRMQLEGAPIVADAFYSAAHNLVVLSPERLDDVAKSYLAGLRPEYDSGWSRDSLIKGVCPPFDSDKRKFDDIYRMSTNAVVDKVLEAEGNRGAVTREASRQLFVAAGMVPQHVVLPRWVDAGFATLLCKPKNPGVLFGTAPDSKVMLYGHAAGYGAPNYVMFREWKTMKARQELAIGSTFAAQTDSNKAAVAFEMLMTVLTDGYFGAARAGVDIDKAIVDRLTPPPPPAVPPGGGMPPQTRAAITMQQPPGPQGGGASDPNAPPQPSRTHLEYKAQATAWGLTYFLAKERTLGWTKYLAELDRLPRDMRLDRKLAVEAFGRAFGLMKPDLSGLDREALKAFAMTWVNYLEATQESWRDVPVQGGPSNGNPLPPGGGGTPGGPG